jgi:uncharacterized protein YlxW (UPF0749 family)
MTFGFIVFGFVSLSICMMALAASARGVFKSQSEALAAQSKALEAQVKAINASNDLVLALKREIRLQGDEIAALGKYMETVDALAVSSADLAKAIDERLRAKERN